LTSWSPAGHIVYGTFATDADLASAIEELRSLSASPVIVATFSGRYLISSLCQARSDDARWDHDVITRLHRELDYGVLGEAADKFTLVSARVRAALIEHGCADAATKSFGSKLDRAGRVAVVVGASAALHHEPAGRHAELVASCALASRPAAVTVDTSLELAVLSEMRKAAERSRPSDPSEPISPEAVATDALLTYGRTILGAWALAAYEASHDNPHRFDELGRVAAVLPPEHQPPDWMPQRVMLTGKADVPAPPELGGSRFDSLQELVDHCFLSKERPRRLVGHIGEYSAYGIPYGFDDARRRPIGVVCAVWRSQDLSNLGAYEMAASRMVAQHLARSYDKRHSAGAVRLVTGQLRNLSNLERRPREGGLEGCDSVLRAREDVLLIAESVKQIVGGLVNLSGAMSVTCRLLSGAPEGPYLSRYLARLHCEGDQCALDSPDRISIQDTATSANAWVAAHGKSLYLRSLERRSDGGSDLDHYDGLAEVSIYRKGVECELCVPIFAEGRLVGTVNLEADWQNAFDANWETVAEYAQLIGIALLEARRRIGVETLTEIEGFLDHRHNLASLLDDFGKQVRNDPGLSAARSVHYNSRVEEVRQLVFMRRVPRDNAPTLPVRLRDVIVSAMKSRNWANLNKVGEEGMPELTLGGWSEATEAVYSAPVEPVAAHALSFAISQALHNIRDHGGTDDDLAGRPYHAMFRFGEVQLGGRRNLYVSVSSTAQADAFKGVPPQCVFRQPIEKDQRTSVGAFLAGEALRRCGGSAYMRVEVDSYQIATVEAEFSVPAAESSPVPAVPVG
jgi:GAF domain-containing protein